MDCDSGRRIKNIIASFHKKCISATDRPDAEAFDTAAAAVDDVDYDDDAYDDEDGDAYDDEDDDDVDDYDDDSYDDDEKDDDDYDDDAYNNEDDHANDDDDDSDDMFHGDGTALYIDHLLGLLHLLGQGSNPRQAGSTKSQA
ncbi:hypothetical protein PoB_006401300 [Plakobranchus ocellatus]|uniref:Phosphopantothenoylcysteine decarboxylase subunit VHS3-like n=1 Tax=Plakobranchus ocellatus TaxID=259542 RepID=A0AAV4D0E2_9GAST|nr:hypothetical protein PoB_006401300 [Plakobranchus ocellatus]